MDRVQKECEEGDLPGMVAAPAAPTEISGPVLQLRSSSRDTAPRLTRAAHKAWNSIIVQYYHFSIHDPSIARLFSLMMRAGRSFSLLHVLALITSRGRQYQRVILYVLLDDFRLQTESSNVQT